MRMIDESADGTTIGLGVGEAVELRLPENASTGFRWQLREGGAPACRTSEADRGAPAGAPPGQGGTHAWRIEGAQPGIGDLALDFGRPWESASVRRFRLRVRVGD